MMRTRLFIFCLLAWLATGCYPEEFDNKTWGPEPELELSTPGVTLQPAEGSSETVTITTNYREWRAEVAADGREWCSVEQREDRLVITVKENTGEKERTTIITVTVGSGKTEVKEIAVTQLGTAPKIVVSPASLSFDLGGGTQDVQVTTNVDTWTPAVSVGSDWCKVSSEGNTLSVEVYPNLAKDMREAMITITGTNSSATTVTTLKVVQMGSDPVLTVSEASAFTAEGGTQTLLVTTNRDSWVATVPSTASWCTAEQDGDNLIIKTDANSGTTGRTCEVLITAGSGNELLMYRLMVAQLGSQDELILSTGEVRFDGEASMQTVSVFTNVDWLASVDVSWCTLLQGESSLTLYVEENPSETQIRRGTVTIAAGDLPFQQLEVVQLPDITIILSVDTLFMSMERGQQAVTVVTNQDQFYARNQDSVHWCWSTVSGNQLIVNVDENEGAPRSIVVNVTAGTGEAVKTVPLVVKQEGLTSDRDILMALYEATGGENWTNHENWGSDLPLSEWYGVTTEMIEPQTKAGEPVERVVKLSLSKNNLIGELPAALGSLAELKYLDLDNNQLTGSIPPELGNLSRLENLILNANQLTGTIPPELGNLTLMRYLFLQSNQLTGEIPATLGNLTQLINLQLSENQLTGSIPLELGNMSQLQYLILHDNPLAGSIPPELGNLSQLLDLNVSSTELTGSIPPELGKLTQLRYLYMSGTQVSGAIPSELGNLAQLQYMYMHVNQLTGSIPPELGNLLQLKVLCLSSNQLSGNIPSELGKMTQLEELRLEDNLLMGQIPPELGDLVLLQELWLDDNQLTGSISPELGNLSQLRKLYLSNNQLTGSIPSELGNLTQLDRLLLRNNQLTGSIPVEFGNLTQLQFLNLSGNQLTGSIPPELGNLTQLEYLVLSGNQFTGSVPEELTQLPNWGITIQPEDDIFPQQGGNLEVEQPGGEEEGDAYSITLLLEGDAGEVNQAAGTHLYGVQVLSRAEGSGEDYAPYGYGIYNDSARVELRLEPGNEYEIYTTLVAEGQQKVRAYGSLYAAPFEVGDYGDVFPPAGYVLSTPELNVFLRDAVQGLPGIASGATVLAADGNRYDRPNTARYFGERLGYVPTGDGVLIVDMTRTLFTVTCEVENLTEGRIRVEIEGAPALYIDAASAEHTVSDVFTFANPYGNWTDSGYSETAEVTFVWEKPNGLERVLSTETVTFVRGNAHLLSTVFSDDGMTMDIENKPLTDGEVINIEGIIW